MFDPATVTWDATNCPAGVYTLTATATGLNGTFQATPAQVSLPATVTSFFENLPGGRFSVSAVVTDAEGRVFGSASQSLTVTPLTNRLVPKSLAASSGGSTTSAPPVGGPSRSGMRAENGAALRPDPATVEPPAATRAAAAPMALSLADVADLMGDGSEWRRFDLIDLDEDGDVDLLRIEWSSGDVRVWRVVR